MAVDPTVPVLDDDSIDSALAILWKRHRQSSLDSISLIEATAANVLRSEIDADSIEKATSAAHKLAGLLGIFGFDDGSGAALEAEYLLRQPVIDGRLLAEATMRLRASVRESTNVLVTRIEREPDAGATQQSDSPAKAIRIVSLDAQLISSMTVEAAAIGLSVMATGYLPISSMSFGDVCAVIVDRGRESTWSRSELLALIEVIPERVVTMVLTENDTFELRADFASSGVAGILPRSQDPGQTMSLLAEAVASKRTTPSLVVSVNIDDGLHDALQRALADSECRLDARSGGAELLDALEEHGADLVVVGFAGTQLRGPDVCRMIRAHPRWHRLPVVIVGGGAQNQLDESFNAGADDYVNIEMSSHDLGIRLRRLLETRKQYEARSDADPLTGTENQSAAERSLDRLFRSAMEHDDPFALALVTVDHFEQIRATEGSAVGDAVLRRLGTHLVSVFRNDDVVGRWGETGFAVGMYGARGEEASARIARLLEVLEGEGIATTSGARARCAFSAGVAAAPVDGSRLASLERIAETALIRARAEGNAVVKSGERPLQNSSDVVDIALVEDDDAMADVIEHALQMRSYRFVRFNDGANAATVLGESEVKAKIVLLDIGLPSLDGFGVLRVLDRRGILDETRVIMLTARSSEAEVLRGISLGATEHIAKPFSIPVLLARLDQTDFGAVA